jgi:hypothetical protein
VSVTVIASEPFDRDVEFGASNDRVVTRVKVHVLVKEVKRPELMPFRVFVNEAV